MGDHIEDICCYISQISPLKFSYIFFLQKEKYPESI